MNKVITIGLIGLLVFFGAQAAKDKKTEPEVVEQIVIDLEKDKVLDYLNATGVIENVTERWVLVGDQDNSENQIIYHISDQVVLLNDETKSFVKLTDLEKGQKVTAFYPENTPVALSLPGQLTPHVLVVHEAEIGFVHVATFDHRLTSSDGKLRLNISDETEIVNLKGERETDLINKTLVVFYTTSTRSIPALTTPEKIIVL